MGPRLDWLLALSTGLRKNPEEPERSINIYPDWFFVPSLGKKNSLSLGYSPRLVIPLSSLLDENDFFIS